MRRLNDVQLSPDAVKSGVVVRVTVDYEGGGELFIEPDDGFTVSPRTRPLPIVVSGQEHFDLTVTRTASTAPRCGLLFTLGVSQRDRSVGVT